MNKFSIAWAGLCLLALGCSQDTTRPEVSSGGSDATRPNYLAQDEPKDALPVGKARETAEDGQQVSIVGVIGGSSEPFIEELAAFTIVDPKVPHCAADEGCPTPWDYCCTQDQVKENVATVKVVDESGSPIAESARKLLGVKELNTVVVTGVAQRDERGNLSIAASQVFVRP